MFYPKFSERLSQKVRWIWAREGDTQCQPLPLLRQAQVHTYAHSGLHTGAHTGVYTGVHTQLYTQLHTGVYTGAHRGAHTCRNAHTQSIPIGFVAVAFIL